MREQMIIGRIKVEKDTFLYSVKLVKINFEFLIQKMDIFSQNYRHYINILLFD